MEPLSNSALDVRALIADRSLETHFQPITSIRRQRVLGMEALSRGRRGNSLIPPDFLFTQAHGQGATCELDSLCRNIAIESFASLGEANQDLMLFVNLHPLTTCMGDNITALLQKVEAAHLAPNRVVVELLEVAFEEPEAALDLVRCVRDAGFLVALDDMGVGHANLDRIAHIRPDILKADRSLIEGIESDYMKQEIFKSLVGLSERIGGWLVAEGIESSEQALAVLNMGGDLMQGYYFARPALLQNEHLPAIPNLGQCGRDFKEHTMGRVLSERRRYDRRLEALGSLLETLRRAPCDEFESRLYQRSDEFSFIESACLLDERGVQICDSVLFCPSPLSERKMVIFAAPVRGTDHSFKEYFYLLSEARLNPFVTQPYVPLPSEDMCVTVSTLLRDARGDSYVLVVHFRAEPEETGRAAIPASNISAST